MPAPPRDEERLTQLLSASPAVIYSFKASGNFAPTFVSTNIETLFGYAPCEYLDNPNFWRERVHPDDLRRAETEVTDLFKNGKHALEYRFRRKDGSYCWVNDEQHVIRDEKGEPVEIVGSWSDITARKQAEEAEDAARERLSTLLESAPAVIYSFKASGDFAPTFVSENIKRLLGYCPDEYLENADFWRTRVHPEDVDAVEAEQAKLFEAGRHTAEYRFRKSDGTYCWVSDEQHLIKDAHGNPLEVVGSWSDITARKTAEQAALQASQRVTDAIESISEGFSLFDTEDRLVLGNYKFAELFDHGAGPPRPGMTYEEIIRGAVERGLIEDARGRTRAGFGSALRSTVTRPSHSWNAAPMGPGCRSRNATSPAVAASRSIAISPRSRKASSGPPPPTSSSCRACAMRAASRPRSCRRARRLPRSPPTTS